MGYRAEITKRIKKQYPFWLVNMVRCRGRILGSAAMDSAGPDSGALVLD